MMPKKKKKQSNVIAGVCGSKLKDIGQKGR